MITKTQRVVTDPLYRGTLVLLINTGLIAGLGFAFWTLAAHDYTASAVGAFSGLSSGISIVSAVASLGLPNVLVRHLDNSDSPRGLLLIVTVAITLLGGALCAIVVFGFGRFFPASLHLSEHGGAAALFTALVILTSLNNVYNAALVRLRAPQAVLWTNLVGAIAKLGGVIALASLKSSGIVVSFAIGLVLSTVLSVPPLAARAKWGSGLNGPLNILRKQFTATAHNYAATVLGILPSTVVPLEVIAARGTTQAAPFALAFLVSGFLSVIPSTASGVLFAEASRNDASIAQQTRKAIRIIYGLLIPATAIVLVAAPYIMRAFGAGYESDGTSTLRILCLSTLATGGNYIVDALLLSQDRTAAYLFMNGANSTLVLGCVGSLLPHGIVGGAEGWALGQTASLALGLSVMAMGSAPANERLRHAYLGELGVRATGAPGELTMALNILESIANNDSLLQGLAPWQTQPMRIVDSSRRTAPPGQIIFFGIWIPLLRVPSGNGQLRYTRQLPVLVAFSGYSDWVSAEIVPSLEDADILTGCWNALIRVGGMPKYLVWDPAWLRRRYQEFFSPLGAQAVAANEAHQRVIRRMYAKMERELIGGRETLDFSDFKNQLDNWVVVHNGRPGQQPDESPAVLAMAERTFLTALPPRPATIQRSGGRPES